MSDRLPTQVLVSALVRRAHEVGGAAVIVAKGDAEGGAILVCTADRGVPGPMLERGIGASGVTELLRVGPSPTDSHVVDAWLARRRQQDPDLWIVELDIADAERFAAEMILSD